jgi:hypothetical protein
MIMALSTVHVLCCVPYCDTGYVRDRILFFTYTRKPKSKSVAHEMEEYDNFTTKNEFTMID